jgi:hypothetical protein
MAIIAMNGAKLEEPNGRQNGFWRENPGTQKEENSRAIMMAGHPVRFFWDWTHDGLERIAIFLSRGQTIIHPEPAGFFEVPVPQPLPEVFS